MSKKFTHPTGFALIFKCFFGILCRRLDIVHSMFDVVLYAINHFALFVRATKDVFCFLYYIRIEKEELI